MQAGRRESCAYCGQPLRLVAGFCAACQAPATVAQRARLIADAGLPPEGREIPARPLVPPPEPSPVGQGSGAAPGRAAVIITRLLLAGGLIALGLVFVAVSVRLNANPIRLLMPPPVGTVVVRQAADGPATTSVSTGQPFILQYDLTVQSGQAAVTLTIAPQHGPPRALTETWPRGHTTRAQTLVALAPDRWQITLRENGTVIAALTLQIAGPPTI